jgi:hypothetical protein
VLVNGRPHLAGSFQVTGARRTRGAR